MNRSIMIPPWRSCVAGCPCHGLMPIPVASCARCPYGFGSTFSYLAAPLAAEGAGFVGSSNVLGAVGTLVIFN